MAKQSVIAGSRIVSGKTITETELLLVENARSNVEWLKSKVAEAERNLADMEADIVAKLESGFKVVSRNLSAGLQEKAGPRRPEWKDLYLSHMEDDHGQPKDLEEKRILEMVVGKTKQILVILHKS